VKAPANRIIQGAEPLPPIRVGVRDGDAEQARAARLLVLFMRGVALLWLFEGAAHWASLLMDGSGQDLTALSSQRITAVFFFCVLDFVAAVGLWLATPWGSVVWLVTVGAQLLSLAALPGFWGHAATLLVSDAVLVPAYVYFAWQAGHGESGNA
jgi:hypothetical protein